MYACKGVDDSGYWWGVDVIDSTEPDYVEGKGVWIENRVPCAYVPNRESGLCPRHEAIARAKEAEKHVHLYTDTMK